MDQIAYQPIYPLPAYQPLMAYTPNGLQLVANSNNEKDVKYDNREIVHSKTNLYIKGLSDDTTDDDLEEMCKKFGKITSTKAIINNQPGIGFGKCKGYGFVDFANEHDAAKAVEHLKGEGHQVQLAKQQEQDTTNIYWQNLPDYVNEDELHKLCERFDGEVVSTRVLKHTEGSPHANKSKGVGFSRMRSKDSCQKIIDEYNEKLLENAGPGAKPLVVKFADAADKNKRKSKNQAVLRQEPQQFEIPIQFQIPPVAVQRAQFQSFHQQPYYNTTIPPNIALGANQLNPALLAPALAPAPITAFPSAYQHPGIGLPTQGWGQPDLAISPTGRNLNEEFQ